MSYILHLETATKVCSVALSRDGKLLQLKEICEDGYSHGENLTLFITEVLDRESIEIKQISAISIAIGPGSYTGLRIGLSVAKGICYATGIPLIAIDSLECIHTLARLKYPEHNIIPMIDARRMEVFCSVYNSQGVLIEPIRAEIIDESSFTLIEPLICCGDGSTKLKSIWSQRLTSIDDTIVSSATAQVGLAYDKFKLNIFEDLAYIEPFYLKEFAGK